MSDASVIKEFLVSLGFSVSETQFKKFSDGIGKATKVVSKLATEVAAAEGAVVAAVTTMAARFEDLYYASQRMRSTVENIRATGYAISQMGGDAAGARAALEGLAAFMRSNPSGERFIASLGVSTRDANGQLRDTSDILRDLGKRFADMPYYVARVRAALLGIDEKTLQALIRGTDQFSDHYHDMAQRVGVDQQKAAADAHEFMNQVRDLGAYLQLLADKYLLPLMEPIKRVIGGLEALDQSTGGASTALIALAAILAPILALLGPVAVGVTAVATAIALLTDDFMTWREGGKTLIDWDKWAPGIDNALAAVGDLGGAIMDLLRALEPLGSALAKIFGPILVEGARFALRLVTDVIRTITDLVNLVSDVLRRDWKKAGKDAVKAFTEGQNLFHDEAPGTGPSAAARAAAKARQAQAQIAGAGQSAGQQALAFFMGQGWSKAQAAGIVAQGHAESGFDPNARGDNGKAFGVFQWHPDRQRAFAQWAGHDIRQSTFGEQLAFAQYELTQGAFRSVGDKLRRLTDAGQAGALLSREYERPADMLGNMAKRAQLASAWMGQPAASPWAAPQGPSVTIHQKTDIQVNASDPRTAGQDVYAQQDRVNGDLVRNARSLVQ